MARVHINTSKAAQLQVEFRDEASGALLAEGHFVVDVIPEGENQLIRSTAIKVVNNFQASQGVDTSTHRAVLEAEGRVSG